MSKIFILPKQNPSAELHRISLKHPKNSSPCDYFLDPISGQLFELNVKLCDFNSWFVNDDLIKDGNIFTLTKIDPLFLLIPALMSNKANNGNFRNLLDIWYEENANPIMIDSLSKIFPKQHLKCVANVKVFEEDIFIMFDKQKTLEWLKLKFESIKKSLIKHGLKLDSCGFTIMGFVGMDHYYSNAHQFDQMAFQILSDYINQDLQAELRTILRIPDIDQQQQKIKDKSTELAKRKQPTTTTPKKFPEEPVPNRSDKQTNNQQNKNKKLKLTHTQRALSKVDKTGIKDIASYFKKM